MTLNALLQIVVFIATVIALAIPLGALLAHAARGDGLLTRLTAPVERALLRVAGVRPDAEMDWRRYALALLVFNALGALVVYGLQRAQGAVPLNALNPLGLPAVDPAVALNTAVSFASNTNWQAYGGETTMSFLVQMAALTTQNFVSAATGIAVLFALARGFSRKETTTIGNFWVDLTRITLQVLLPLSFLFALVLVALGVPQTLTGSVVAHTAGGAQAIALGPVASQLAIKQLGTNGGGFFNVNAAHPFENPSPFSGFLECTAILVLAAACVFAFGQLIKDRRQAFALVGAMLLLFVPLVVVCVVAEQQASPLVVGVDQLAGNMEGKEVRFGVTGSALWAAATSAASNGSVNAMHDSFSPLGGLVPLVLILLGEVVFGGVGSGLYGLLLYAIIAVFIAGLMVGRTPEYLGKKLEAFEMKMASLAILVPAFLILGGTAVALMVPQAAAAVANPGAHGFSEILYAFASTAGNNGSAFAGLTASGTFFAVAHAVCMWCGRYWIIVPVLAVAGALAQKKQIPASSATLPTHTPLFVVLLAGTVLLVGLLTFVPALALGPVAEHFMLWGSGGAR